MKSIQVIGSKELQQIKGGNDTTATHNGTTQSGRNLWNDFLAI